MSGARPKPTAQEGIATADWRQAKCLSVSGKVQQLWKSAENDARDAAKQFCQECPIRRDCLKRAIAFEARGGIYAGFNFESATERREAEEWLGWRKPRVDGRRKRVQ